MRSDKVNVYSVAQVNSYIKQLFARDFALRQIYVKGEVSNCKYHSTGHIYFTLKDSSGVLAAVMFAGNRSGLAFPMREGQKVIVYGSISVYDRGGSYQLYAKEIHLDGQGDLYLQMEELKKRLGEMGMFAPEYKQQIPPFASRVGIVTAQTGAAIRDICNIAHRRNPYVQLILCPAVVQGEYAVPSIVRAIERLDQLGLDCMIVGRGGGSIEDLWAFNEEAVARAIFDCRTPVISAVGHETDVTIADYVADLRAPTPSAAAELAVFDLYAFLDEMKGKQQRMSHVMAGRISQEKLRLRTMAARMELKNPRTTLEQRRQGLVNLERQLSEYMQDALEEKKHRLMLGAARLEAMSPLAQLQKGYSFVTLPDGTPIRSVEQVNEGDELQAAVIDGQITLEVKDKISIRRSSGDVNE